MAAKRKIRLISKIGLWDAGDIPGCNMQNGQQAPALDAYLFKKGKGVGPAGAVLICPGGGYSHLAEHEGEPVALWLHSIGYAAFVLHYRVAPYRHPYPLADARRALCHIRFFAQNYGVRSDKIGVLGFSAGAHLAASLATQEDDKGIPDDIDPVERMSSRPDFMILGYPVVTFSGKYAHQDCMKNLFGHMPSAEERAALSIEQNIHDKTPPCFIWHTADDETVPVQHSLVLASAMQEAGIPVELHVFPHGYHGMGLAAGADAGLWTDLCAAWLSKQM